MSAPEPRFGTDGVRGIANQELTAALALRLGMAAAYVLARHTAERHVVVGRDTRLSGDMLEGALNAGLASMGALVTNVGVAPTPAVSRVTVLAGASAGAVISASHNPFDDNGIKFFGPDGRKLSDAVEDEIEAEMRRWDLLPRPTGAAIGRVTDSFGLLDNYVRDVRATARGSLTGLKLVLDCANGAAWQMAPSIFFDLGAGVEAIHTTPNGININAACGSTKPADMCRAVRELGADAGLAFDGDCDRVMMCDERGEIVDGDRMMAICALAMRERGELPNEVVVATIMSNAGLEIALERAGIALLRTDVGDRYVSAEMERSGASLGGEQSGHLLFPRLSRTGDGMVTGLQVLGEMQRTGRRLSELAAVMESCPQILRNVRVANRELWKNDPAVQRAVEDARLRLGKPEWLSVRASGTEPLVRVMAQGMDGEDVRSTVDEICELIERTGLQ